MSKESIRVARRARLIAQGRKNFVIRYGMLFWGVSTGLIFALYQGFSLGWEQFPRWLGVSLVIFPVGGWFWGVAMWRFVIRAQANSNPQPPDEPEAKS